MTITDNELAARARELLRTTDPSSVDQTTFRGAQYDAGLAWVHFPEGLGGLGLNRSKQSIVDTILAEAPVVYHTLHVNPMGIAMAAPTLLAYATRDQQIKHLRAIFTGEDIWCQLFSEPSNGSDIAGIHSRAVRSGDHWIVNGQKVWTTLAHVSRYAMLLTRSNPDVPKHAGLSYFILDMHSPGIEVRPLFQITGEAEFNEVFLTDVRIPHANMLGGEGDGWKVATTTLMNERAALGSGGSAGGKGRGAIRSLLNIWEQRRNTLPPSLRNVLRDKVTALWAEAELLRLTNLRARALARAGTPGPEGSIAKLTSAELQQRIYEACVDLAGPAGMLNEAGYPMKRADSAAFNATIAGRFLRSPATTIEGGTSEIMRNILGERVLGLPSDIRIDKNLPWSRHPH